MTDRKDYSFIRFTEGYIVNGFIGQKTHRT